ncbi:hypothetical protein PPL_00091 [Heterostelium album PN500]|uniref:Uncharacterized protein n=1 Tax=Heterostelium pallidum (strain ATCC 26659 / Pp 5 / PN500) TaxID=670386 RepID=D3AVI0_HETP5|nr:hypothetical protein PPL_00091 [Heterostelium album PN500]EFA86303.1 hypothetical protein PPL_00091 [Heterostelium album PN500]|eukprot:XP_020438408.1 hypothetical protein PPL_00091 [Heterostelium album PN500]
MFMWVAEFSEGVTTELTDMTSALVVDGEAFISLFIFLNSIFLKSRITAEHDINQDLEIEVNSLEKENNLKPSFNKEIPNNKKLKFPIQNQTKTAYYKRYKDVETNVEIVKLYIQETNVQWTWDRPEKKKCHFTNKRDYIKQPILFVSDSNDNNDNDCEIQCPGKSMSERESYTDGSIFQTGKGNCVKSVHFSMENDHVKRAYDVVAGIFLDSDVPLPMFGWDQYTYAEKPSPKVLLFAK